MTHTDDAHAPGHDEHTGHGAHHVNSRALLLRTFGGLVGLTVLTVGLAFAERAGILPLGGLSVPVALTIAGVKATLVALFFMGLKYDNRTNAIAFIGSIVFLVIFLSFTMLDTMFRDTFEATSAVPVDIIRADEAALMAQDSLYDAASTPASLVIAPDTLLLPGAPVEAPAAAAPATAPAPTTPAGTAGTTAAPAAEAAPATTDAGEVGG